MSMFPTSPSHGDPSEDGKFYYQDPPGKWQPVESTFDEDLLILAAANNGPTLAGVTVPYNDEREVRFHQAYDAAQHANTVLSNLDNFGVISQIIGEATSTTLIDLSKGRYVHIASTAGNWSPVFENVPVSGLVEILLSVNISANGHEMIPHNSLWKKGSTIPTSGDYQENDQMVFKIVKLPYVSAFIYEWVLETLAPEVDPPPITPPTLTGLYSVNSNLSSAQTLTSASLPQMVYAYFGPVDDPNIAFLRIFHDHVGDLPAIGEEGDSFVGSRITAPYLLLGRNPDNSAVVWDTRQDPTGNNRAEYDENGPGTFRVAAHLIDGQIVEASFAHSTTNAPVTGSDPVPTHTTTAYVGAASPHTINIPAGVDRAVLVVASYRAAPAVGQTMNLDNLTLNGVTMTKMTAASRTIGAAEGLSVTTAYLKEANLSTGSATITPVFSSPPGTFSAIIYDVYIITNAATPDFVGIMAYGNVAPGTPQTLAPSLPSVPANSMLMTVLARQAVAGDDPTVDIGTMTAVTEQPTSPPMETRSSFVLDSGAVATKTATWDTDTRSLAVLVYLDYAASTGGGGEEPVPPIIPGIPVINTGGIVVADNQVTIPWLDSANAESYEIRWGQVSTPNVPSGAPVPSASPKIVTGLAASVSYGFQVRAKSSTGHYSAWSTTVYRTPTGTVTPPASWRDRYLVSYDHRDVMMGEGYGTPNAPDFWTQRGFVRINVSNNDGGIIFAADNSMLDRAINNWAARGPQARPFRNDAGPRLIVTSRLGISDAGQNWDTSITRKVNSILEMAKSGSTGAINRNSTWTQLGNKMNRQYYHAGTNRSYNVYDIMFYSVAHETNGSWAATYQGTNVQLKGRVEFTAAGGATTANYGASMAAALQRVGETGACDDVHRLAVEHIMGILWSIQPKIIIGMTPAASADSAPDASQASNLSSAWVESAHPRASAGFGLDFFSPTFYNRNHTTITYDGTGDIDLWSNYNSDKGWLENEQAFVNEKYGCPFGLLEFGNAYAIPGEAVKGTGGATSDEGARAFLERVLEHELIDAPGKSENGLCFINHWNFLNWVGSDQAIHGKTYGTFNLLEGCWGRYPDNTTSMTSTAKPSWSTQPSPYYPKALAYMKSQFST